MQASSTMRHGAATVQRVAALDHQTLTWAEEELTFRWYSLDPGDMRTAMQQAAFRAKTSAIAQSQRRCT